MKLIFPVFVILALLTPNNATAQSFAAGSGANTCKVVIRDFEAVDGEGLLTVGWILGFWSATTIYENKTYDDAIKNSHSKMEENGVSSLVNYVIETCRKHPDQRLQDVMAALVNDLGRKTGN